VSEAAALFPAGVGSGILRGGSNSGARAGAAGRTEAMHSRREMSADDDHAPTDEALAERVRRDGDAAAFGLLVGRYRARVVALSRRMLSSGGAAANDDAEDVAQEAFVAAYHKRATYRGGTPFRPWLYRIAVNRCLDRLRARGRQPGMHSVDDLPEPAASEPDSDPLDALLADECEERLREAVAALPPKHRAVFLLRHVDDLSYEEIAAATDLPMGTVKTHLFRARARLRRELTGYLD
jgi:RNA polymerase sigma-70 factor (ECF subfamily)